MRERYVLKCDRGYLKPEYDLLGRGIGYTHEPSEASRFVTMEVAVAIAKEIALDQTIKVEAIFV